MRRERERESGKERVITPLRTRLIRME